MFLFKKIMAPFLLPPGIFVTLLLFTAIWFFFKKNWRAAIVNFLLGCIVWLLSITPVSDAMLGRLESGFEIPENPNGDVIILLSGGIYDGVPDFSGLGAPSEEMLGRVITAVRLHRRLKIPIIVSGGRAFKDKGAEAPVVRRFLIDLGVPEDKIIIEEKSRDTLENARNSAEICARLGYKKPLLVTSASHMVRAVASFQRAGMEIRPFPASFKSIQGKGHGWEDYLPDLRELRKTSIAMKEYIGFLFYKLVY